jgi:integrase
VSRELAPRDDDAAIPSHLHERARSVLDAARAPNTIRAYKSDIAAFEAWCATHRRRAVPATPATLAGYVIELAATHRYASIARKVSAISVAHKRAGHVSPRGDVVVKEALAGVRRSQGRNARPRKKTALRRSDVSTLLEVLSVRGSRPKRNPNGHGAVLPLRAARDRALILVGFACGLRRSELVAIRVEDIERTPEGLLITLGGEAARTKTNQIGAVERVGIAKEAKETIRALDAWLKAARIRSGPVFRSVLRSGKVADDALSPGRVTLIVKRIAEAAGLEGDYGAHSLRAGFLTSADEAGKGLATIMAHSRHRSREVAAGYIQGGRDPFEATRGVAL